MIDAATLVYCVLGDPVAHSLSPLMHNAAFAAAGINGAYLAFNVRDLQGAVSGIRSLGIRGASVTIPHKVAVMAHLDNCEETATRIGAVNTIVNRDGRLTGYNTDCRGAIRALAGQTVLKGRNALILGAGGAARAIGFGMVEAGARVTIANRSVTRGERLAGDLGAEFVPLADLKQTGCDTLVNATAVGMAPHAHGIPVPQGFLRPGMVVMDAVYNPVDTRLIKSARNMGCATIDGVAMFVYQGALQFELWTGMKAPLAPMRQAVVSALRAAS